MQHYRWSVPASLEIYRPIPANRYVATAGGGRYPMVNKLPNGRLVLMTRDGDFHVGQRGRLSITTSDDGGESWSATNPVLVTNPDACHLAFGSNSDGVLMIFYVLPHTYVDGKWDPDTIR